MQVAVFDLERTCFGVCGIFGKETGSMICGVLSRRLIVAIALAAVCMSALGTEAGQEAAARPYAAWKNGPSADAAFFPIAVWLQNPARAAEYRKAGINVYVGLWRGPTEEQLAQLKAAGMKVVCEQNKVAMRHLDDPTIIGWMHGDEPDNAQSLGEGKGYGPPIEPRQIVADYEAIRAKDPSRPVLLNLGQGVAYDNWIGRGVRRNHPEDYPKYIEGCDIVSFDIYPVVHDRPEVAGKLWYVADGVERLVKWSGGRKVVWNCIECTRIGSDTAKATPQQVRSEVWMSLIHGSQGLIYFVHEWKPRFNEAALLADAEMLAAVTKVNTEIAGLAPVLNSPTLEGAIRVVPSDEDVPVAAMVKRYGGSVYAFAVAMRGSATETAFALKGLAGERTAEVIGEGRTIAAKDGAWRDAFEPWGAHLYRINAD